MVPLVTRGNEQGLPTGTSTPNGLTAITSIPGMSEGTPLVGPLHTVEEVFQSMTDVEKSMKTADFSQSDP